jgi:hypothetical protein
LLHPFTSGSVQPHFPETEDYNRIWGQGNCICDIRKSKLAEVVHIGDDTFKMSENDVEIGDGDAYTTGRHYALYRQREMEYNQVYHHEQVY